MFSLKSLFLWQGHLTAPYCVRESCFDKVDDPAYLPNHHYLSSVSPDKQRGWWSSSWYCDGYIGSSREIIMRSGSPFFASMSSQASVFLGKGMAAQTELLRSPIFKRFWYKLNNEVTMLIIFDPTLSRAALESQSDFLWWTPLDGYGLGLQNRRTFVDKIFCESQSESSKQRKFWERVTFWEKQKIVY